MTRRNLLAAVAVAAIIFATPVRAASSALVVGLVAVGVVATVVAVAASQRSPSPEPKVTAYAPVETAPQGPQRRDVLAFSDR